MKRILQILLCVPMTALADDTSPAFTSIQARSAQTQYEKSIQRAEAELQVKRRNAQQEYLEALDDALDRAMRALDLDEANRIKSVIDAIEQERNQLSAQPEKNSASVQKVAGTWNWPGGRKITITKTGTLRARDDEGTWECIDVASKEYVLRWKSGFIDTMVLSSDGNRLKGENNTGDKTTAIRAE